MGYPLACNLSPSMTLNRPRSRSPDFSIKYIENCEIWAYDVGRNGGQVGNHLWAFDWHYELWPRITLNCTSSRSLKLQSNMSKTVSDSYDDGFNRSPIGNHPQATDWQSKEHWGDTRSNLTYLLLLLLWPPCVADADIIFLPCALWFLLSSSIFFYLFSRLISAVAEWMSTILPHMVWP